MAGSIRKCIPLTHGAFVLHSHALLEEDIQPPLRWRRTNANPLEIEEFAGSEDAILHPFRALLWQLSIPPDEVERCRVMRDDISEVDQSILPSFHPPGISPLKVMHKPIAWLLPHFSARVKRHQPEDILNGLELDLPQNLYTWMGGGTMKISTV